jgi:predicted aspartyl protease
MALFVKCVMQMDFDSNQLAILPASTEPSADWGTPIPAPSGLVRVALNNEVAVDCAIDTGSTSYLTLPSETYDGLVEKKVIVPIGESPFTSFNSVRLAREGHIRTTKIGDFEDHNFVVTSGGWRCQIGLAYLRQYQVTLDLGRNRIYLAQRMKIDPLDRKADVGIGMLRKSAKTVVGAIKSKSPAEKADVRLDDEVVAVDGEAITNQPIAEIRRMMRESYYSKGAVNVRLLRNGKQRSIVVENHE